MRRSKTYKRNPGAAAVLGGVGLLGAVAAGGYFLYKKYFRKEVVTEEWKEAQSPDYKKADNTIQAAATAAVTPTPSGAPPSAVSAAELSQVAALAMQAAGTSVAMNIFSGLTAAIRSIALSSKAETQNVYNLGAAKAPMDLQPYAGFAAKSSTITGEWSTIDANVARDKWISKSDYMRVAYYIKMNELLTRNGEKGISQLNSTLYAKIVAIKDRVEALTLPLVYPLDYLAAITKYGGDEGGKVTLSDMTQIRDGVREFNSAMGTGRNMWGFRMTGRGTGVARVIEEQIAAGKYTVLKQ